MKLQFKTLSRACFTIDAEPSEKVIDLKKKVAAVQGFDVERQNIIFKGKILADDLTVEECHFTEKDFIVVMEMKKKKAPAAEAPKPSTSASEPKKEEPKAEEKKVEEPKKAEEPKKEEPKAEEKPKEEAPKEDKPKEETAPAATATETASQPATSSQNYWEASGSVLVTGEAYEQAVNNLIEMGFEKDDVVKAMRASFNNPDRAAEYLMTGIPEHLLPQNPPAQPAAQAAAQPAATQGSTPATAAATENQPVNLFEAAANAARPAGAAAGGQNNLAFLNNNPEFQRLRELIHTNPQLLQPILQQLGQSNPELMEVISANPDAFVRLLEEGMSEEQQGGENNPLSGGAIPIQISQEEAEAITR
ncbi:UV excision repair protein Rad23, partial [Anaeromyces robustus]